MSWTGAIVGGAVGAYTENPVLGSVTSASIDALMLMADSADGEGNFT